MDGYWIPVRWNHGYNRDEIKRLVPEGWEEVNLESYAYVRQQVFHRDPVTDIYHTTHNGFMMDLYEYFGLAPEDRSGFQPAYV